MPNESLVKSSQFSSNRFLVDPHTHRGGSFGGRLRWNLSDSLSIANASHSDLAPRKKIKSAIHQALFLYTWGKTQVEKKLRFLRKLRYFSKTQVPKMKKMTKSANFRAKKAKTQTNFAKTQV